MEHTINFALSFIHYIGRFINQISNRMKRIILIFLCSTIVVSISQAQYATAGVRKELEKVDLSFLVGEPKVNVIFIYDSLTVMGVPEFEYILKTKEEKEKKELGKGGQWEFEWTDNRIKLYEPEFLKALNGHLRKFVVDYGPHPDSKYIMLVHVTDLYPGTVATWTATYPEVNMSIYFFETANTNLLLESFSISATGPTGSARTTDQQRMIWIYQNAGKFMGYNVLYQRGYGLKKKK